ncbi:MAG: lytic murein transglycosylase [Patescibacteria group bacterium]|nr:lytic murein transglycosylase [Patescibacteria group bacterium]
MYRILITLVILFSATFAYAQETCPTNGQPLTAEQRVICQKELDRVNIEIAQQDAILNNQKNQSASLSRDIAILNAKIEKAKLDIRAKTIIIQGLSKDITKKQTVIVSLSDKIIKEQESLAQLLRKTNEIESYSLPEMLLSQDDISSFFLDLDNFDSVKQSLKNSFEELRQAKDETKTQKQGLEVKRNSETDAQTAIQANKRAIEKNQTEVNRLLSFSKTQEKSYQALLDDKARRASEIRSALFALRDSSAIPFAKAFEYATIASQQTGVRPAFLLAILTQESNLGKNVGSCLVTNFDTGAGIRVTSNSAVKNVMKPTRDIGPFREITSELGIDPLQTKVSCPLSIGYGGAMGPAQFIPSTWQSVKSRLASMLKVSTPNPWEPRDAFMASAMYLSDLGADVQTYSAERNSACKYYSGSSCGAKKGNTFYGNSVMALATNIQENMINLIQNN